MNDKIDTILAGFMRRKSLNNALFKAFLVTYDEGLRADLVAYFEQNKHIDFVRYLLKKAIKERKKGTISVYLEDLCLFSFILAQHNQAEDVLLIWEAKRADFDTWCGFDGALLGFIGIEHTLAYLKTIKTPETEKAIDYIAGLKQVDVDVYFSKKPYYL